MSDKDDCISRQMALDAFGLSEKTRKYCGDHSGYDTRMLYEIQDTLENLPAVQPDHNADVSKKAEGDCISRKEALKICRRYWHPTFNPIMEEIEKLPSAQPDPHWIPCRKKLPEKEGFYLVQALMNGDIFVARWEGCYWNIKTPIVAWMPLPEPYRGGDE